MEHVTGPVEPTDVLSRLVGDLATLARRRRALPVADGPAADRARQLVDHVESYLVPRSRSLDAPLVVVLVGPTGAGKSTLMNALVGSPVSRTGVLRPTTREAVLVADADDARPLMADGALARIPRERLEIVSQGGRAGLALIDAPDIDSIERDNRALADGLVEAADLCIFVTTATRYADQVPWDVLGRVQERGLPLMVVVNRLPASEADADSVVEDVRRLLAGAGLDALGDGDRLTIVPVREGDLDASGEQLGRAAVEPVLRRLAALAGDRDARRALAARALAGALAGTGPLMHAVADDLEHEAIDADAVRRVAEALYAEELRSLQDELRGGRFLREEVLRQWLSYVGADQVTRFFSSGIGRLRGSVLALFRGTPSAPVAAVEEEATSDLAALTLAHLADAARRTAARWSEMPHGAGPIGADDRLWSVAPDAASALETRFADWVVGIASDVQATGGPKRALARGASIGVNTVGVGVMLSVFAHTGGLTGAEVGVAAATAFLNQKLLNALFGEAAVVEMVDRARRRLAELLTEAFAEDRARFDRLVPSAAELREVAGELRALEARIRGAGAAPSP